ncbi:hypothetical protein AGDE_15460 [Angomonas deanei]|uniref:Uncharacterized protein n=1 Tax=Angomonas deanei TaxID=59799 RepID=A0A7G2CTS7_9TRYP|nr:hypothetical protein AGDE_15460 [Angomonas deanei]CAD2222607.1 hypothetical protein, conserved [Angomonas deanei]|eukprot:EPY19019.1 hypothetical protein AGDE_15460 [Angomonas deanei]
MEMYCALDAPQEEDSPYHSFYLLCQELVVEAPAKNQICKREVSVWYNADVVAGDQLLAQLLQKNCAANSQQGDSTPTKREPTYTTTTPVGTSDAASKIPYSTLLKSGKSLRDVHTCKNLSYVDISHYEVVDHLVNFVRSLPPEVCEGFGLSLGWALPSDGSFHGYGIRDIAYMHHFVSLVYDAMRQYDAPRVELITFAAALDSFFPLDEEDSHGAGASATSSDDDGNIGALLASAETLSNGSSAELESMGHPNDPLPTALQALNYLLKFVNSVFFKRTPVDCRGDSVRSFITFWRYFRGGKSKAAASLAVTVTPEKDDSKSTKKKGFWSRFKKKRKTSNSDGDTKNVSQVTSPGGNTNPPTSGSGSTSSNSDDSEKEN